MKSMAVVALCFGVFAQLLWLLGQFLVAGVWPPAMCTCWPAWRVRHRGSDTSRWRWFSTMPRAFLGVTFLLVVADRFGLVGRPGTPGVSWGDWERFVADTRPVNAFLPARFAPTLARGRPRSGAAHPEPAKCSQLGWVDDLRDGNGGPVGRENVLASVRIEPGASAA
jgi:hypothetical protein